MVSRYQADPRGFRRISGPLLVRADVHVELPSVEYGKLSDDRLGEPSAVFYRGPIPSCASRGRAIS
jgi:hypothetical protein